jgi:hypothetical protein
VRGVASGAGDREIDAAQLQLLDALRIVRELARRIDLDLVASLRVLLDLLAEELGRLLPRPPGWSVWLNLSTVCACAAGTSASDAASAAATAICCTNSLRFIGNPP